MNSSIALLSIVLSGLVSHPLLAQDTTSPQSQPSPMQAAPWHEAFNLNEGLAARLSISEAKEMGENIIPRFVIDRSDRTVFGPECTYSRRLQGEAIDGKDSRHILVAVNLAYSQRSHRIPEALVDRRIPKDVGSLSRGVTDAVSLSRTQNHGNLWTSWSSFYIRLDKSQIPLQQGVVPNLYNQDVRYQDGILTHVIQNPVGANEKVCEIAQLKIEPTLELPTAMKIMHTPIIPRDKSCFAGGYVRETTCELIGM